MYLFRSLDGVGGNATAEEKTSAETLTTSKPKSTEITESKASKEEKRPAKESETDSSFVRPLQQNQEDQQRHEHRAFIVSLPVATASSSISTITRVRRDMVFFFLNKKLILISIHFISIISYYLCAHVICVKYT